MGLNPAHSLERKKNGGERRGPTKKLTEKTKND